jgi:hypothetical protein
VMTDLIEVRTLNFIVLSLSTSVSKDIVQS